jgi:AcrR family transcriptional regulator
VATRKKNAEATREAILHAAQGAFTRLGYDSAGVREIGAAAGANAALVNRYFGSKLGLFAEAVSETLVLDESLLDDRDAFCRRFVLDTLNNNRPDVPGFDPTLAMMRSAANPQIAELLRTRMEEQIVHPLAEWLGGEDAEIRSALILSVIAGVCVLRDVLSIRGVTRDEPTLAVHLTAVMRALVEPPATPSPAPDEPSRN